MELENLGLCIRKPYKAKDRVYIYEAKDFVVLRQFYKIKIFSNEEQMWEYDNDIGFYGKHKPYSQRFSFKTGREEFIGYEDENGNCYQDHIGEILLCEGYLSSRHIVHEITHATLYYFEEFVNETEYEEEFCYLLGDCVSLVYNALYDYKIIV